MEGFTQSNDFTDFEYSKTLKYFGFKMDYDLYKEEAKNCCPLALRAMLTSIVRQEHFCDGTIAKIIENGTISAILESYKNKMRPQIL